MIAGELGVIDENDFSQYANMPTNDKFFSINEEHTKYRDSYRGIRDSQHKV